MTTTAALFSQPAARPAAGESKAASTGTDSPRADRDEFAKLLDTEIDETDANAAQQPAATVLVAPQPAAQTALAEEADLPTQTDASAVAAFEIALAGLSAEAQAAPAASEAGQVETPVDAEDAQTVPATSAQTAATPAATSAVTTVMILAGAASPAGKIATGKSTAEADTLGDDTAESEATVALITPDAPQSAPILATAVAQPQAPDASTAATDATAKSAASIGAPATPATPELPASPGGPGEARADAADQPQAATTDTAKPTQPAHAVAQAAASAPPQANAQGSAVSADIATQAIADASATTSSATAATAQPAAVTSEAAKTAATPAALQSAPAATIQVYSRIIERSDGRAQRFEVRLDPAELGRVDVRIEIGVDKKVHAVLAAHDSAALTDLMRGQRALERALTDAGLDLSDKGVSFELSSDSGRGNANQQREGDASNRSPPQNVWRGFETTTMPATAEAAAIVRQPWQTQRYDLVA